MIYYKCHVQVIPRQGYINIIQGDISIIQGDISIIQGDISIYRETSVSIIQGHITITNFNAKQQWAFITALFHAKVHDLFSAVSLKLCVVR